MDALSLFLLNGNYSKYCNRSINFSVVLPTCKARQGKGVRLKEHVRERQRHLYGGVYVHYILPLPCRYIVMGRIKFHTNTYNREKNKTQYKKRIEIDIPSLHTHSCKNIIIHINK